MSFPTSHPFFINVFLWRHTWHFEFSQKSSLSIASLEEIYKTILTSLTLMYFLVNLHYWNNIFLAWQHANFFNTLCIKNTLLQYFSFFDLLWMNGYFRVIFCIVHILYIWVLLILLMFQKGLFPKMFITKLMVKSNYNSTLLVVFLVFCEFYIWY